MATTKKPWPQHHSAAGCRRGLICYKEPEDLPALKVPHPPTQQCPQVLRYARGRARSAMENRRDHESSGFFIRRPEPTGFTSNYALEYCPKKLTSPTQSLPLSPTRMNNPHPNKEFIMWRLPGRTHRHKNSIPPNPIVWHYINETFYEDCRDTTNNGGMGTEVPITNVAQIPFPGNPAYKPASHVQFTGRKMEPAQCDWDCRSDVSECGSVMQLYCPPNLEATLMHHTVKRQYVPVLKEWLKGANDKERDVLLSFLKEGQDKKSDQKRLEQAVKDVLRAGTADGLQGWIDKTSPCEKKVVLKVLENLKVSTSDRVGTNHPGRIRYPSLQHRGGQRRHTYPKSAPAVPPTHAACSGKRLNIHGSTKRGGPPIVSGGLPQPDLCPTVYKISRPESHYDENPPVWHNRIMRDGHLATNPRAGGFFQRPHRNMGQHFTITPEWPTA